MRQFFACAVYRTRNGCQFFHWADETIPETKREEYLTRYRQHQSSLVKTRPSDIKGYCGNCETLIESHDTSHDNHMLHKVTKEQLNRPTQLIYPRKDNKGQAV